jgi:hypothetical protein
MANVSDTIPPVLQQDVNVALDWFNASQPTTFEVTGIVDADLSMQSSEPRELQLVLCGGDTCLKRNFHVSRNATGVDVTYADDHSNAANKGGEPQAELDPPPGARRHWLDSVLAQHEFTLLIFYRGFW